MKFALLFATAVTAVAAQTSGICTTSSCTSYCHAYDSILTSCASTNANNVTAFVICSCTSGTGLSVDTGDLELCTACNQNGLGSVDLSIYQSQAVICLNYLENGQAAALSVASEQETAVVQQFSATYLPIIQSVCPVGALSASASVTASTAVDTATSSTGSAAYGNGQTNGANSLSTLPYGNAATSLAHVASTTTTSAEPTSTFSASGIMIAGAATTNTKAGATTSSLPSGATVLTAPSNGLPAGATVLPHANAAAKWQVAEVAVLGLPLLGAML